MSDSSAPTTNGITARTWAGIAVAVIAVVFILQNRDTVTVQLFTVQVASPQWLTLSVIFVLGLVSGLLVARRRR